VDASRVAFLLNIHIPVAQGLCLAEIGAKAAAVESIDHALAHLSDHAGFVTDQGCLCMGSVEGVRLSAERFDSLIQALRAARKALNARK
jgi:hypothetical protein